MPYVSNCAAKKEERGLTTLLSAVILIIEFLPAYHLGRNITFTKQLNISDPGLALANCLQYKMLVIILVKCVVPENLPLIMEDCSV